MYCEHGIDPAPERGKYTSWSTFLEAHWDSIAATDFFSVEVLRLRGLVTCYVLFVLELASQTVKIAGITSHPDEAWMMQMARNLTDAEEPFLRHARFLIMDRDTKYSAAFRATLMRGADRADPRWQRTGADSTDKPCHRGPPQGRFLGESRFGLPSGYDLP